MHIMITSECNQGCPYCFAADAMGALSAKSEMEFDDYRRCIDLVARSERKVASLFGGEPTLHPEFERMVDHALGRGLKVQLFTNFIFEDDVPSLHDERVTITANINSPDWYPERTRAIVENNVARFRRNAVLGFNVYSFEPRYEGVIDWIDGHDLANRSLRLGIASPTPTRENAFIPVAEYDRVGGILVEMARYGHARKVKLLYDCGFVRCMFTEEQIATLSSMGSAPLYQCGTPVDVAPDLSAFNCFPLSAYKAVRMTDYGSVRELTEALATMYQPYLAMGVKRACPSCEHHLRGECFGGCLGHVLAALDGGPMSRRA